MPSLLTYSHCSAWVMGIDQLAHSVALDPNSLGPNLQRNRYGHVGPEFASARGAFFDSVN
jgi:hypothetical protein